MDCWNRILCKPDDLSVAQVRVLSTERFRGIVDLNEQFVTVLLLQLLFKQACYVASWKRVHNIFIHLFTYAVMDSEKQLAIVALTLS